MPPFLLINIVKYSLAINLRINQIFLPFFPLIILNVSTKLMYETILKTFLDKYINIKMIKNIKLLTIFPNVINHLKTIFSDEFALT